MDSITSPVLLLCFSLKECLPCRALGQIVSPKQGRHLTVFPASVKATEWIQCCFTTNAPAHWNCRFACARLKQKRWRIVNVESKFFGFFWSETESSLKNQKDRGFPPQTFWWIARCRTPKFLNKLGTQQHSQCKHDAMGGYGKAGCAHPRALLRRETQPKLLVLSPKWVS